MRFYTTFVVFASIFVSCCYSANIFAATFTPFYSHQATFRPLWKELAKSHKVTLMTLNTMEYHENITQIDLRFVYDELKKRNYFEILSSGNQTLSNIKFVFDSVLDVLEMEVAHPEVQKLIHGNQKFDLVIAEMLLYAGTAFAEKFDCPLIGFVSMEAPPFVHSQIGNPAHPILYPAFDLGYSEELSFPQRLASVSFDIIFGGFIKYYMQYHQNKILGKYFGGEMDVAKKASRMAMLFTNANPIFFPSRPLNFRTVNVDGGLHIEKAKPLPEQINSYLDESDHGVIYFSLGSSVKSSHIANRTLSVILNTFAKLPYCILWKFEEQLYGNPQNVKFISWGPQQDILRHSNVKLFISQGGLQSLEESLFSGVPVLALPFFGDQFLNSKNVVKHGFGLTLDRNELKAEQFRDAVLELINNPRYKENAVRLSKILNDQPMTGLEKAVFWTNYVLRHKNVDHLRNPNEDIPFYQYLFLDIFCFSACFVVFIVLCFILSCKITFRISKLIRIYLYSEKNIKIN